MLDVEQWAEIRRMAKVERRIVCERLASEHERMRPLPEAMPSTDRRWVLRVPSQPYLRFDRNDYSLDPRLVGRRVEVRPLARYDALIPA